MEKIINIKEDLFKEVYSQRATVLDKSAENDADYKMYEQPDEYWISGAGKNAAWLINFRFVENISFPNDSLVNIYIGDTILKNIPVRIYKDIYSVDFSPIADPENEGEILSQFSIVKEIIESQNPIYFEPSGINLKRHIVPGGNAKFRMQDIDFEIPSTMFIPKIDVVYTRISPKSDYDEVQNDVINMHLGTLPSSEFLKYNPTIVLLRKKNIHSVKKNVFSSKLRKSKLKWVEPKNTCYEYTINQPYRPDGTFFVPRNKFTGETLKLSRLMTHLVREKKISDLLVDIRLSASKTKKLEIINGTTSSGNTLRGLYAFCIRIDNPLFNRTEGEKALKTYTWNWQPRYIYGPKTKVILGIKQVETPIRSLSESFIKTIEIID